MQSNEDAPVLFDSWGFVTPETLKACKERTKKWKPALLEFAVQVNEVMKALPGTEPTDQATAVVVPNGRYATRSV